MKIERVSKITIELCLSVIGAVTGIVGAAIGIFGVFHNRFLAVHQYLEAVETPDFIEAKAIIYNSNPKEISLDSREAAQIINFFHHWGLLAKKHYLPLWVFDSGTGAGAIRLYELTQDYIRKRQYHHKDSSYASNFTWLYFKLQRRKIKKKW